MFQNYLQKIIRWEVLEVLQAIHWVVRQAETLKNLQVCSLVLHYQYLQCQQSTKLLPKKMQVKNHCLMKINRINNFQKINPLLCPKHQFHNPAKKKKEIYLMVMMIQDSEANPKQKIPQLKKKDSLTMMMIKDLASEKKLRNNK